jgi:hypothetical protein
MHDYLNERERFIVLLGSPVNSTGNERPYTALGMT